MQFGVRSALISQFMRGCGRLYTTTTMSLPNQPLRTSISYTILFIFLTGLLWSGVQNGLHTSIREALGDLSPTELDFKGFPDFSQYVPLRTISEDELALDHRRLIIVGDIHGMKASIEQV